MSLLVRGWRVAFILRRPVRIVVRLPRQIATSVAHPLVHAIGMASVSCLLTSLQSFFLIRRNQAFPFLLCLLPDLAHLLALLLRRERSVGAHSLNLRMRVPSDRLNLLHHGTFNPSLLHTRSRARRPSGSSVCRWSALSKARSGEKEKKKRAEKFPEHGGALRKL